MVKAKDTQPKDISKEEINKTLKEHPIERKYLDLTKSRIPAEKEPKIEKEMIKDIDISPRKQEPIVQPKPEPNKQSFYEPAFPQHLPQHQKLPTSNYPMPGLNPKNDLIKNIIIGGIIIFTIFIVSFFAFSFSQKDFSTDVNVTNNPPNIPMTNNFNNTFTSNQTIVVNLDDGIAEYIANQTIEEVKRQLNSS